MNDDDDDDDEFADEPPENVPFQLRGIPAKNLQERMNDEARMESMLDDMRMDQLVYIDQAGKRMIEWCTALLGVLFAISTFGNQFPPAYLHARPETRWLALGVLACISLALLCGVLTVQPSEERFHYRTSLDEMRAGLLFRAEKKKFYLKTAYWLFFAGVCLLAGLLSWLILTA